MRRITWEHQIYARADTWTRPACVSLCVNLIRETDAWRGNAPKIPLRQCLLPNRD